MPGKSTLVNALVGSKVAIVTPKVQTTRMAVRGVAMAGETQIVFVDTPGIFKPRRRLDRAMVNAAWAGAGDADAVVLLVDAAGAGRPPERSCARDTHAIIDGAEGGKRQGGAGAQQDRRHEAHRSSAAGRSRFHAEGVFEEIFMISALKGDGVADLSAWVAERMPEGPWLYPEDQAADIPSRLLAAEITREKIYLRLHDELPYASTVETEKWEERNDGSVKIDQMIYVQRDGQKAIVLGKGGATIKLIGEMARKEMEDAVRPPRASVPVREGARGLGRTASTTRKSAWISPRNQNATLLPGACLPGETAARGARSPLRVSGGRDQPGRRGEGGNGMV